MSKLYKELAEVYEAMYSTFINYRDEFTFYGEILRTYNKKSVLEIGSGTGNLSKLFTEDGLEYLGLDLSVEMLEIAKKNNPNCVFIEGDMRNFELEELIDSILITGRSISYLLTNEDLNLTFQSIHRNLQKDGIFCFDFIDANRFIPEILKEERIIHKANFDGKRYIRESRWVLNLHYGMDLKWDSKYGKELDGEYQEIGGETEVVRSFTKDEIEIFLEINDFEFLQIIDRQTYAFPTYVIVAKKK